MGRKYVRDRYGVENGGTSASPQDQENRLAGAVGGRAQPGSGSSIYAKGDVRQKHRATKSSYDPIRFLFECKQTEKMSLSIKAAWLGKITREAMQQGLEPALQIEIQGYTDPQLETTWIAVPFSVFRRMQVMAEDVDDDDERTESNPV